MKPINILLILSLLLLGSCVDKDLNNDPTKSANLNPNFQLTGIPAAPRGVPQIEVTFDIDANGIVHVSAKDLGSGKETGITITSSTNMNKDDVERAVKEAEQYAAEDKKRREAIDTRNNADQIVYQTEKTVKDLGDKISADDKATIEKKTEAVKEALKGTDDEMIKAATDDLAKVSMEVFGKVYQSNAGASSAAGPDMGGAAGAGAAPDDGVVDADYREVDDN